MGTPTLHAPARASTTPAARPPRPTAAPRRTRPARNTHLSDFTALTARIKSEGLLARSYGYYWSKLIGLPLALAAIVALSFAIGDTWWQLALAVAFALVMAQVGYLGHDAAHRQIFASGKRNKWASLIVLNLIAGMGFGWWQGKPNQHHPDPNQVGAGPDIGTGDFAYSPDAAST